MDEDDQRLKDQDTTGDPPDIELRDVMESVVTRPLEYLREYSWKDLLKECAAEFNGTLVFIFFGCGAVASAILTNSLLGLWQIAVIWGFGLSIAIYITGSLSGAHLNPSVSFTMALFRRITWMKMLAYMISQFLGAFCAGLLIMGLFSDALAHYEAANGIIRGNPGSELSAMVLCEFFPNPGLYGPVLDPEVVDMVSPIKALVTETFGSTILGLVIFSVTDKATVTLRNKDMAPFLIGFTVACLISLLAPITQAGFNPARDFGPRIVAVLFGWGEVAIPSPKGGFWVYLLGPMIGNPLGAAIYQFILKPRAGVKK